MTYIPASAKCNNCGIAKQETNNWYMIHLKNGEIVIYQFDMNEVANGIPCVCGEKCLQIFLSRNISVIYPPSMQSIDLAQVPFNEEEYKEKA